MQIHHIVPDAKGGTGDYDNGIPVCLDCHAEVESRSNMGRRFSERELKELRDRWFTVVREQPEVILRASATQTETGPLEALLAELDFNRMALTSTREDESFPPLAVEQFKRAIATNALSALEPSVRENVQQTYVLLSTINFNFDQEVHLSGRLLAGRGGDPLQALHAVRKEWRLRASRDVPETIRLLQRTLGQDAEHAIRERE